MKNQKQTGVGSIREVAAALGRDRDLVSRTIHKHALEPAGKRGGRPVYRLRDVALILPPPMRTADTVGATSLRDAKLSEEVRKLRLANDRMEARLIAREAVASEFSRLFGPIVPELERLLLEQYPNAVAGLDVPQARIYGKRVFDEFLRLHREAAERWTA